MMKTIHVFNGDAAAAVFKNAFNASDSDLLVFREVLSCGPVQKLNHLADWQAERLTFWSDVCTANCIDIETEKTRPRDFYCHFIKESTTSEFKVWLGTGLSDQLMLAFMVQLFDHQKIDISKLQVIQFESIKNSNGNAHAIQGIGLLNSKQIKQHPKPIKINHDQQIFAKLLWKAFSAKDPSLFSNLMCKDSNTLLLLKSAMTYIYYRYPKDINGLSDWDESLLKHVVNDGPNAHQVIGATMADAMDGLDYCGDSYLYYRLKNLANTTLNAPLLKLTPKNKSMQNTQVEITEFGKQALDNKINVIEENGIDDWIGGVHFCSDSNHVWLRDKNNNIYQHIISE